MRKICLVCNAGMSTSLLVSKMRKAAEETGYECEIEAYGLFYAEEHVIPEADIVLFGPQMSFEYPRIREKFPDKIIMVIDTLDYGMMKGAKVLDDVKKLLHDA